MIKIKTILFSTIVLCYASIVATPASLLNPQQTTFTNEKIITSPYALLKAARFALSFFQSNDPDDKRIVKSALLESKILPSAQAKKTLQFIIKTIEQDHMAKRKRFRIQDPQFLKKHFTFIKWNGDYKGAAKQHVFIPQIPQPGNIRLTSYAVFSTKGNHYKTKNFPHPLYRVKSSYFKKNLRMKYSKQTILKGLLEQKQFNKHVSPMVWVSRNGLEEALMQGTIVVVMPNGQKRVFNVNQSNEFSYDRKIKSGWPQKKYWFFKEIKNLEKTKPNNKQRVIQHGGLIVAGDLDNFGLGKIIALRYSNPRTKQKEIRLVILADRGSAFENNLYQLDLFAGMFKNRGEFKHILRTFPPTVQAYFLKVNNLQTKG